MNNDFKTFEEEMAGLDKTHQDLLGAQPEPKVEMAPLPGITPAPFQSVAAVKAAISPVVQKVVTPGVVPTLPALSPITLPTVTPAPVPSTQALKPIEPIGYKQ